MAKLLLEHLHFTCPPTCLAKAMVHLIQQLPDDDDRLTPLCKTITSKPDFDPNVGDFSSMTPVVAAIEMKRTDVLKILLERDDLMVGEEELKAAEKATSEIHQMLLDRVADKGAE